MLKSISNFIGKLFAKRCYRKVRKNAYWLDVYPSPGYSWLRKAIDTTGDKIYNNIDNFFQGSANRSICVIEMNDSHTDKLSSTHAEWELNQDIIDIAIIDIRYSFGWILPGFLKKFAFRLYQLVFLYLFTDLLNEEEIQEWHEFKNNNVIQHEPDSRRVIYTIEDFKNIISSKCLSLNGWLKSAYNGIKLFLKLEQNLYTYYLPGYFAPQRFEDPQDVQNYMIRGPGKVKLNPAFSFHKRI